MRTQALKSTKLKNTDSGSDLSTGLLGRQRIKSTSSDSQVTRRRDEKLEIKKASYFHKTQGKDALDDDEPDILDLIEAGNFFSEELMYP